MYQALYRKWRPQVFSDVVGQTAITETLKAQVEAGRLSHAYLFSGSRGTGKTTCAKILAKAVNCEHPRHGDPCNECASCRGIADGSILDVIEIDAASNNGVDNVRELREEAVYSPAQVKKRVYIIDEVHMFTSNAFNALLKIMEEPPEHVLFILATTEQHKVLPTILSRCQRFAFKRINATTIAEQLRKVARGEGIVAEDSAIELIARLADGGMRDALSIFDQCASSATHVTVETVEDVVGLAGADSIYQLVRAIAARDTGAALAELAGVYENGRDLVSVLGELETYLRDVLVRKTAPDARLAALAARVDEDATRALAETFSQGALLHAIGIISETLGRIGYSANRRIDAELCVIRLCQGAPETDTPETEVPRVPAPKAVSKAPPKPERSSVEPEQKATVAEPTPRISEDKLWETILTGAKDALRPGTVPILREVHATMEGEVLCVATENPLCRQMLSDRQVADAIRTSAGRIVGREVQMRVGAVKPAENNQFQALCAELENHPNVTFF